MLFFFFFKAELTSTEIKQMHQASELFEQILTAMAMDWMIMGKNDDLILTAASVEGVIWLLLMEDLLLIGEETKAQSW